MSSILSDKKLLSDKGRRGNSPLPEDLDAIYVADVLKASVH